MTVQLVVVVAVAGAAGALCRAAVDGAGTGSIHLRSTLLVNMLGSLAAGMLLGVLHVQEVSATISLGLGVGFLGALTTFSTWIQQMHRLLVERQWGLLIVFAAAAMVGGPLLAIGGVWLMTRVLG